MARNVDLLEGSIVGSLTSLALPIMATSLIQMAYNMTDMIWIGRLSADAVAAVGAAGMYLWLANGLAMIPRLGGQVKVAHELGAQAPERAAGYGQAAFHLGALLVILFTAMCILLNGPLIAFFKLNSPQVNSDARVYLVIVALGFLFSFFNQIFTGLFTAMGSSVVVLRSTAVGLVGNILLDPLMIKNLPRKIAAATGVDALAHAIECYTSNKANPISDTFALEALDMILNNILPACDSADAVSQKSAMQLASFYAGVAITASGTTAVHALSYPLGGKYHIAHGVSNAILLAPVMRFNAPACPERFAAAYDRCVHGEKTCVTQEEKTEFMLRWLEKIVRHLEIPTSLSAFGVSASDLETLVAAGMQVTRLLNNNLRPVTADDARALYRRIL